LYDTDGGTTCRILSAGTATAWTTLNGGTNLIPPNAVLGIFGILLSASLGSIGALTGSVRPTGSTKTNGYAAVAGYIQVAGTTTQCLNTMHLAMNSSRQIDYQVSATPGGGGLYVDVQGYTLPN
jgi:hypothetical protein